MLDAKEYAGEIAKLLDDEETGIFRPFPDEEPHPFERDGALVSYKQLPVKQNAADVLRRWGYDPERLNRIESKD